MKTTIKSLFPPLPRFHAADLVLFGGSVALILGSFFLFHQSDVLSLIASLVGVTSLTFCAKGHPIGQMLMIAFAILYGIISYECAYYGEMLTYVGMSLPMAVVSLISWMRHPYAGDRSQVAVRKMTPADWWIMVGLNVVVTVAFWFLLGALHTANLLPSTISVTTSFAAVFLTARRSPFYALAYAANDIVLLVLWVLAALQDPSYISVIVCFSVFLLNDLNGFRNWRRMEKAQSK